MHKQSSVEIFRDAPVSKAVLQNACPAMAAMLMVLVYNLADAFFIGRTHDGILVAAVSLATPVFLIFMALGTIFGVGGTSVISRAIGEGKADYAKKISSFCMWSCIIASGAGLWDRFKKILRFSLAFALILGLILTGVCLIFNGKIVAAFLTDETAYELAVSFSKNPSDNRCAVQRVLSSD